MNNYLADVLQANEEIELDYIKKQTPDIANSVKQLKDNVLDYLENVSVRFLEHPKQNKELAYKVDQCHEKIKKMIEYVEEVTSKGLHDSVNDVKKHVETLETNKIAINYIKTLCELHEGLIAAKALREKTSFLACSEKIENLEDLFETLQSDAEELSILNEMNALVNAEKNLLYLKISNIFNESVIFNHAANKSIIKICNDNVILEEVLLTLYLYNTSVGSLNKMTKFLWQDIIIPIVDYTTEIKVDVENEFATLEILTVDPNKKSSYVEVFDKIKTVVEYLLANFNLPLTEEMTTLAYIGRDIRDNLSELLIKHCLQDTIPLNEEDLKNYTVVIEATKELESFLQMAKIFAEDTTSILDYANNVDVLFINRKCQDYLDSAQILMKKDLHDVIEVGSNEQNHILEKNTSFPRCCVSRSVLELLELLEKILQQAVNSSEICADRLICTVTTICWKYGIFVPEHHKKLLQTIPQQIALFYNNCEYICYKLKDLYDSYSQKLPSILNVKPNCFNEQGEKLREIGHNMFLSFLEGQVKHIKDILKESGLDSPTLEQVDVATEKCVRQCLRQQELLKTVWHKVLSYDLYNKTLGMILNSLCNCIIEAIVKFEDITSEAAEQLIELLRMVQTRGPKLFTDPKEITLFVNSWYKLNELVFILNASLMDINDRWADGKGPLALQFQSEELKQLIRALFQNTERRAALLNKIHN